MRIRSKCKYSPCPDQIQRFVLRNIFKLKTEQNQPGFVYYFKTFGYKVNLISHPGN